jgi:dihydroorotase
LYVKALIDPGHISWLKLIDLISRRGAQIIKSDRGTLKVGSIADVTVIDSNNRWTIDPEQFKSKSRNCPFTSWQVKGRAIATIVAGQIKWRLPSNHQ